MNKNVFRILSFKNAGRYHDPEGKRFEMFDRPSSSFVFVLSGRLRFTDSNGRVFYADRETPLYLPRGVQYLNESVKTADSLMLTFTDNQTDTGIRAFHAVDLGYVGDVFNRIERSAAARGADADLEIIGFLYLISDRLFSVKKEKIDPLFVSAVDIMLKRISDSSLTVGQIAASLFISEVFLRRIFHSACGTSPAAYLTDLRMTKAREYLAENRNVTETAEAVGYTGIYSFSRSYKRHFGVSPTGSKK